MRRRPRIDLGPESAQPLVRDRQGSSVRDEQIRERKRKRWAAVNKNRAPEENPFLAAIKPNHDNFGDPGESTEELRARLESLEFGNYPGYFNYRNKAASVAPNQAGELACDARKQEGKSGSGSSQTVLNLEDGLVDERLRLMRDEWFRDKDVLDIGCNRGHVTYAIAKLFAPRFILGVDIDLKMINMANRDLHLHLESDLIRNNIDRRIKRATRLSQGADEQQQPEPEGAAGPAEPGPAGVSASQYMEDEQHYPIASYVARGPLAVSLGRTSSKNCDTNGTESGSPSGEAKLGPALNDDKPAIEVSQARLAGERDKSIEAQAAFPNNILFVEHNYVLSKDELVDGQRAHFDTIVCLSVTKWIHLNYRDEGLKRFFKRAHKHLKPGGLFVLEAQPFDNYHRKRKLSERLRANFQSIKFKPDQFDEFLLGEQVGFKRIIFSTTTEHECAGFKRPMKVFLK